MRKYRKTTTALTSRGLYLRKRIARNRSRAKFVGFLYLLSTLALTAVVCLFPLLTHELGSFKAMEFWKVFKPSTFKGFSLSNTDLVYKLVVNGLYGLMLLGLLFAVLRSLGKLGWLFKKSANKTYGFNRNVYAMEDLGKIFSGSYALILVTYFLIAIFCKNWGAATYKIELPMMLAVLGGGVFIHLFCGILGMKTRYYDFKNGEIEEAVRVVGRFAPFFRNLVQLGATFAMMFFFLKLTNVNQTVAELLSKGGVSKLLKDMNRLIFFAAQVLILLCTFVLIKHATGLTEYNFDGVHGSGMKNFRVFSFFILLFAGGAAAYDVLVAKAKLNVNLLVIAGIAFGVFIIELIMRKMPRFPADKDKKKKGAEEEFNLEDISFQEEAKVDQSF